MEENKMSSRKFWFSLATSAAIVMLCIAAAIKPALAPVYPEAIAGLIGVLTVYSGSNVAQKWALNGKTQESSQDLEQEAPRGTAQ